MVQENESAVAEADQVGGSQVFISYSWSSDQHQKSIIELATRLRSDGVDVILDVWDLKKGNNLHKFMESMVTSKTVSKVLLIIDRVYQQKADDGVGGVGIETEIVSSHIYNKASQDKFIPIVWELDENGQPYLPTFLKSRLYINLSPASPVDEYQELLRTIFNKPRHVKPALGKPPAFLQDETVAAVPSSFHQLKQQIQTGSLTGKTLSIKTFFEGLTQNIQNLAITDSSRAPTDDEVVSKIQSFEPILLEYDTIFNDLVDSGSPDLLRYLKNFFETCLKNYSTDQPGRFYPIQYAPVQYVSQEILLHTVAIFLKNEKFEETNDLFNAGIIHSRRHNKELGSVFDLYEHLEILDRVRNERLGLQRSSLTADLLKERTKGNIISFEDVAQADLITFLRAEFTGAHWYPRTLVYFDEWRKFDLFLRSEMIVFFQRFSKVIAVKNKADLQEKWEQHKGHLNAMRQGWRPLNLAAVCNLDKIATK